MKNEISYDSPLLYGQATFATPDKDLDKILDFLEDMIIMTGCPMCSSLNTRLIKTNRERILICLDCGSNEILPPAS